MSPVCGGFGWIDKVSLSLSLYPLFFVWACTPVHAHVGACAWQYMCVPNLHTQISTNAYAYGCCSFDYLLSGLIILICFWNVLTY